MEGKRGQDAGLAGLPAEQIERMRAVDRTTAAW
jgi:hypothetical protein